MPTSSRQSAHVASVRAAFCGMITALSLVLMLTSSLVQIMVYAAPLLCGLLLIPCRLFFGRRAALLTFLASALLVLVLGFDKELALFYLFFGCYPLLKWRLDRILGKARCLLVKIAYFSMAVAVMYLLLTLIFPIPAILAEFQEMGRILSLLFLAALVFSLMLYDRVLTPLTLLYVTRYEPRLKKLLRL